MTPIAWIAAGFCLAALAFPELRRRVGIHLPLAVLLLIAIGLIYQLSGGWAGEGDWGH
ncbi:MAG: hypothetical protein KatS3mg064_0604 [Tepidiforma sp.]|nr:hypothetical protein [Tepidiforma sp.]GIW17447.1 MAG: hypothetical protein KatS3mg064_0604 [Tepidiforma sp.]